MNSMNTQNPFAALTSQMRMYAPLRSGGAGVDREVRGVRRHGHGRDGADNGNNDERYVSEAAPHLPAVEVVGADRAQEEGQQRGSGLGLGDDVGSDGDGDGLDVGDGEFLLLFRVLSV